MAGLFGFFDYTKPGPGVRKDEPKKNRFMHFWELFLRKFWRLCLLNLLYLLFCLPVVTIGPATAGLTYVLRNLAEEQPVFLFYDFWDAFRKNWKQALAYSLLFAVGAFVVGFAAWFYFVNAPTHPWMLLPAVLTLLVALLAAMMNCYGMLMIVTLDLPLRAILKNAAILAVLRLKTNLLTLLFTWLLLLGALWFFLPVGLLLTLFLLPALVGFLTCYNAYPGIRRYVIEPYLEPKEQDRSQQGEETVAQDKEQTGK